MTPTGIGWDSHRLVAGRPLILGGVTIPHDRGLDGHSDADVLTHAWDLARATGQPTELDDELSNEALMAARRQIAPSFRGAGRPFGEEQPCPAGGTTADQLAAFLGRVV